MSSLKRSKQKAKGKRSRGLKPVEKTRKQLRKELRAQKKINRVNYVKRGKELRMRGRAPSHPAADQFENPQLADSNANIAKQAEANAKAAQNRLQKSAEQLKEKKLRQIESKRKRNRNELLKEANLKEDRVIKKLEKQLKLNKRKKQTVPKSFAADGLDYLLNFCLEKDRKNIAETEKELLESELNGEFNADTLESAESRTSTEDKWYSDDEDGSGGEGKGEGKSKNDKSNGSEEERFDEYSSNESDEVSGDEEIESEKIKGMETKASDDPAASPEDSWEDIYGRKRDKDGNVVRDSEKYIAPGARAGREGARDPGLHDEKLLSIRRQLKGCLNRLTEHNVRSIANQIEEMYMTNSRSNTNYVLSGLMLESLVTRVITPTRLISEHAMLIAILHANVGIEVGANFLEKLVAKFIEIMGTPQEVENKELDNAVLMISHLYNFKIFGNQLLYQILDKLMNKFTEKEIELILLILKTVGFLLRKDDPNALKEFIHNMQKKASDEDGKSSRVKYMLEILLAIKNNNVNKIPQYDPSHLEHLRKVTRSVIRKGNTVAQLNVSLEDLLHANEKGKWWIVGSAWSGSGIAGEKANAKERGDKLNFGKGILELAQKQRMNTDTRKNIFCILMTAEDYLDAFEKLHHLGLKDQQEGEIVHVLMHCCLQEKKFNPYYAILAQKLCEYNRKYQLTIQYAFWDKLKSLQSYGGKQLSNLAQFLTHLFIERCLALSALKIVEFTELDRRTMQFLREIMLAILLHRSEQTCVQAFQRISASPQLQTFRESLRLFVSCFLVKNIDSYSISDKRKALLKQRAELVDKVLTFHGSRAVF